MSALSDKTRREFSRFLKFSVVGTIGAVIDFGTFNLLNGVLGVWSVLASMLSFTAAVTSNFLWNRYWTYPDSRSKPVHHQVVQFGVVNLIGLFIRTPIFAFAESPMIRLAERYTHLQQFQGALQALAGLPSEPVVLGRNAALALAVLAVLFWNFGINRIWTYSDAP